MKRLIVFIPLFAVACSSAPEKPEPEEPVEQASLEGSDCLGDRVPPTGWQQATAFAPVNDANAAEAAKDEAVRTLRDRICQGYRCSEVESKITLWNTQADARHVCAMAVIKGAEVAKFQEEPHRALANDLDKSAVALIKMLGKERPKIAIDNVRDNGVDGGERAEWLIDRMNASLSKSGSLVGKLPNGWSGLKLPPGIDAVLRGRITRMHGRESMLEVTWTLDLGDAFSSVDPIVFPEFIGPNTPSTFIAPDLSWDNREISIRFDARPGGGLCNGQKFEIRTETKKDLHIRLINVFGDNAMLIRSTRKPVKGGQPQTIGKFMALKMDGIPAAEQFIAMGAEDLSDLEKFAQPKTIPCRLPVQDLSKLRDVLPPQPFKTSRSFRIVDGNDCSDFAPPEAGTIEDLKKIPMCW